MEGKGEGRGTKTKMAPAVAEAIAATLDSKDERKRKLLSIICGMVPANDNAKIALIFQPMGGVILEKQVEIVFLTLSCANTGRISLITSVTDAKKCARRGLLLVYDLLYGA